MRKLRHRENNQPAQSHTARVKWSLDSNPVPFTKCQKEKRKQVLRDGRRHRRWRVLRKERLKGEECWKK